MLISVPGPPSLRALQASEDSIYLTWLPPSPAHGHILGFILHQATPNSQVPIRHPLPSYSRSYSATNLRIGVHRFWITARTQVGEGKASATVSVPLRSTG